MNLGYTDNDKKAVTLAALLHDIGKFEQRCYSKKVKHEKYGFAFIDRTMGTTWQKVAYLVESHHDPGNYSQEEDLAKVVAIADWLSASEREYKEKETGLSIESFLLHSIFSKILIPMKKSNKKVHYRQNPALFPLNELSFDLSICSPFEYDVQKSRPSNISHDQYKKLWDSFESDFKKINFDAPFDLFKNDTILTNILALLERYASFLPSAAYVSSPDISLFSHLKAVAAIASCILSVIPRKDVDKYYHALKLSKEKIYKPILDESIVKLLMCDISGIQDFIYDIKSERALRNLKGRSAYIQILSECIARFILSKCSLSILNIMFLGGGNFYLMLPANIKLPEIKEEISEKVFNKESKSVSAVIESVDLALNDFTREGFSKKWYEVGRLVGKEKRRKNKFILLDKSKAMEFFEAVDARTGKKSSNGRDRRFEEISQKISNAKWLYIDHPTQKGIEVFDSNWVFEKKVLKKVLGYSVNSLEFLAENGKGFLAYANHTAIGKSKDSLATLEDLADRCDKGKKAWGVVRADIDNLGKIFRDGLLESSKNKSDNLVSISRMSTLSYMFSIFFNAHIQTLMKREKYANKSVVVYAGGDDLFIIGSWDILPDLTLQIKEDFKNFTMRDDITISASIYVAPGRKYPVKEAAEEARLMLKRAKDEGKNRICFLDNYPLTWDEFYDVRKVKDQIMEWIDKAGGQSGEARSLIRILRESLIQSENDNREKSLTNVYRLVYSLKRWLDRQKGIDKNQLPNLRDTFIIDYKLRDNLKYAVRWAELLTKQE